jgi:uncharacterized protein (TIGR02452 family)
MPSDNGRRESLRKIAEETLAAIDDGYYRPEPSLPTHLLHTNDLKRRTLFYAENPPLSWASPPRNCSSHPACISVLEISTLDCARLIFKTLQINPHEEGRIGVLNFASATKPGGGFINGAESQQESIARASNLYPSLMTKEAQKFYDLHKADHCNHYHTHSMIYSPGVQVFRDEEAKWTKPISIEVLTSAAVNAGEVRKSNHAQQCGADATEKAIVTVMRERMGRILYLFEINGVKNLVLGSFGTGALQNEVNVLAGLWAELLSGPASRFGRSFDRVFFAILGKKTYVDFANAFNDHVPRDRV